MPVTESISKGELEKYLKGVILEDSTEDISNFYTELSVREILPITRQLFEEKVCLTREFEVLQFVKKEKHLIVYGEAGSGKTWTLRWLGTACARKCLEKKEGFVPIYAALDSYVKGSFYDYLRRNAGKKAFQDLISGNCWKEKPCCFWTGSTLLHLPTISPPLRKFPILSQNTKTADMLSPQDPGFPAA